jgi:glucose-1-phosphate cytidylyltransferase
MVEIGERPILWHIMKHYSNSGFKEFVILLGYKSAVIKSFMLNYRALAGSLSIDMRNGEVREHDEGDEDWIVHLLETGSDTMTGGRIRQAMDFAPGEELMLTYGDGVSNVDLQELLRFHRAHGKLATLTVVRPKTLFGHLDLDGERVVEFVEKPQTLEGWINGGFFVLSPGVREYLHDSDSMPFEQTPLVRLARDDQLRAYPHEGFWQSMDSVKDKRFLEELWAQGSAPWKTWA